MSGTISPPGGIDLNLWLGVKGTINPSSTAKKGRETTSSDTIYADPRPWTEKFFEGQRSYYFIINSQLIKSLQHRYPRPDKVYRDCMIRT